MPPDIPPNRKGTKYAFGTIGEPTIFFVMCYKCIITMHHKKMKQIIISIVLFVLTFLFSPKYSTAKHY